MQSMPGTSRPPREAALKPSAAGMYPYLPARMWTTADRLAALVGCYRRLSQDTIDRVHRILPDQHFMFRDGRPATA